MGSSGYVSNGTEIYKKEDLSKTGTAILGFNAWNFHAFTGGFDSRKDQINTSIKQNTHFKLRSKGISYSFGESTTKSTFSLSAISTDTEIKFDYNNLFSTSSEKYIMKNKLLGGGFNFNFPYSIVSLYRMKSGIDINYTSSASSFYDEMTRTYLKNNSGPLVMT